MQFLRMSDIKDQKFTTWGKKRGIKYRANSIRAIKSIIYIYGWEGSRKKSDI